MLPVQRSFNCNQGLPPILGGMKLLRGLPLHHIFGVYIRGYINPKHIGTMVGQCCDRSLHFCSGTRLGGFLRFLSLVACLGERTNRALVVDPDSSLKEADRTAAVAALAKVRELLGTCKPYANLGSSRC